MTSLVDRDSEDQPWVVAGSVVVAGTSHDRVFVGNNDFAQPGGRTATVDLSANAATAAAPAGFAPHQIARRVTVGQDGPPVRVALHRDGTVYAAFQRWVTASGPNSHARRRRHARRQLGHRRQPVLGPRDPGDGKAGRRVATGRFVRFNATMGQERLGADLAIAVDPASSKIVWLAWCDRVGGASGPTGRCTCADQPTGARPGPRTCARSPTPRTRPSRSAPRAPSASPTSSSRPLGG